MTSPLLLMAALLVFLSGCTQKPPTAEYNFFLDKPTMIVNYEQDNTIEGNYLTAVQADSNRIHVVLPADFAPLTDTTGQWVAGWGSGIPLYDSGQENIRTILDIKGDTLWLGELLAGSGYPQKGQRLVFWNRRPSGFFNHLVKPVLSPRLWPNFRGNLMCFASVVYDSLAGKWVTIVNETGEGSVHIYAGVSDNLLEWQAANQGQPILYPQDFSNTTWANADSMRTPYVADLLHHEGSWYLFMDGYSTDGKRHIGVAVSEGSALGPYSVHPHPIISPGEKGDWDDLYSFYPAVTRHNDQFIMAYCGRSRGGTEQVGLAYSTDLLHWTKAPQNPVISQHTGWRSKKGVSEPAYIEVRNDSIFLLVAGAKKFKMGPFHHYITRRMYMDVSGNVNDAQLGLFVSADGGHTFIQHKNNPVFINDYANIYSSQHLGANFALVKTDTANIIFHQAKANMMGGEYNVIVVSD